MRVNPAAAAFVGCALAVSTALADLLPRLDGQAVYDTDLGITWLADAGGANSARTAMTWAEARDWADTFSLSGATDWRLPATLNPDPACDDPVTSSGFNCAGSEMGHLFYAELEVAAGQSIGSSTNPSLHLFENIEGADWWSGTSFTIPELAWHFRFANGLQSASVKDTFVMFVWPVHNGDVFAEPNDMDADGVPDDADNCLTDANADQRDTDSDGFGNLCDGDFNQDCAQNFVDLGIMKGQFFQPGADDTDLDGDGATSFTDLGRMKQLFFQPPGPSLLTSDCQQAATRIRESGRQVPFIHQEW